MLRTTDEADILEVISDLSNDEVFTPPKVANAVLDLLPETVWSDAGLRWLDPASKTGVFLREAARRMMRGLETELPNEEERLTQILEHMLFGLAITELTALMSRRTMYCSKDAAGEHSVVRMLTSEGNVWFDRVEHSYDANGRCTECSASESQMERENRENYAYAFIHEEGRAAAGKDIAMKFDVIVGNPPYQMDSEGNNRTMPLYHKFFEQAKALDPQYISMIMPARWMAGGLGLGEFRATMLADKRIRILVDYPDASEVFPGVDIKGGVCFLLWDRDNPGDCEVTTHRGGEAIGPVARRLDEFDVFVRDFRALSILEKVLAAQEESILPIVRGQKPFGLSTSFRGVDQKPRRQSVRLYRSGGPAWVEKAAVEVNNDWIDRWKVLVGKAGPGNSGGHVIPDMVLGQPQISEPGSCCTDTFVVIGPVASEEAAKSLASYMRTRFFRFLVSLRKVSQDASRTAYTWVPVQEWNDEWTDAVLYEKYGITKDEQAYIAAMIREMPG